MKIYKSKHNHFYFAQKNGEWWCFSACMPDLNSLQLCHCSFGWEEEKDAFDRAIDVSHEDEVAFYKIQKSKDNYNDVCEFIRKYYNVEQTCLDEQFNHYPYILQLAKEIIDKDNIWGRLVNNYSLSTIYKKVKEYMRAWNNDVERTTNFTLRHNDIREAVSPNTKMVDVWVEDTRKSRLYHDFHNHWSAKLDELINEACEKYPLDTDFDKRYYYVLENK